MIEGQFIAFFITILVAVLFSSLFSRFNIPWAVALILGGIIAGPDALGFIEVNDTLTFLSEVGAVFLMFMAGLETPIHSLRRTFKQVSFIAFLNGAIPFVVGFLIGHLFGFSVPISFLIGVIFISSSVAVVIPTLDRNKMLQSPIGHAIIGSTIIQDVSSLILISIFLQAHDPVTNISLPVFYFFLAILMVILYKFIHWIRKKIMLKGVFHQEFQFVLAILIGVVALFTLFGLHHIIAGFFAGFVLADTFKEESKIKRNFHTVGYGIFIPLFFVLIGANVDLAVFLDAGTFLKLTIVLLSGLIVSKFISGYAAARMERLNQRNSLLIAITSIPQLATTLAVVYTAYTSGIIENNLVAAFVIVSVVTTLLSPLLTQKVLRYESNNLPEQK